MPLAPLFSQAEKCGTEWVTEHYQRFFPKTVADLPIPGNQKNPQSAIRNPQSRSVVTIPVVVHVVYFWNFENISKAQIESQIDVLNADFRKLNSNAGQTPGEFKPLAADCQIEFCLASKDPSGAATEGITRRKTSIQVVGSKTEADGRLSIKHDDTGGTDAWDESKYLNIWLGALQSGLFGFATFPGTAPQGEDGVVIDPRYFGTTGLAASSAPQNLGRTATHEIGHYFNLKHIWGNTAGSCTIDDDVADTPQSKDPYSGCPVHPQLSCGNTAMFMNYMDYVDDACMTLFTLGQRDRMADALNNLRPGLLTSPGCGTSGAQDIDSQPVALFPNPAGDRLFIENISEKDGPLMVWNALGQPISCQKTWSATSVELDVSHLPPGPYTVGNARFQKLFVKT